MQSREPALPVNPCDIEPFHIHDWLVEPALNRLRRLDDAVQVEPRIMHVLVCLASRPGKVIPRDALLDVVWGKVVINEEALTQAISHLRRVFGDDAKSPRFIQTIHKTGYRLVAPVGRVEAEAAPSVAEGQSEGRAVPVPQAPQPGSAAEQSAHEQPDRQPGGQAGRPGRVPGGRRLTLMVGGLMLVIAVVSVMASLLRSGSAVPSRSVALEETPFTTYPGKEIQPAISPDGTRIAFVWDEDGGSYDLYVKQRNTETPLRLTQTDGNEWFPAWSPDAADLAYVLASEGGTAIYVLPAIGGVPRKVLDTPHGIAGLDWSPDGRLLACASRSDESGPLEVWLLDLATGERQILTTPVSHSFGDLRPAFSPDGRRIAFIRGDRTNLQDIFVVPVEGGEPQRLTYSQHSVVGLDWMPDGKSLVFASAPNSIADTRLWRLALDSGALTWLTTGTHRPARPTIAWKGRGLIYEEGSINTGIFMIRTGEGRDEPTPFISSTRNDYAAQFSPGGKFVSFISNRSGSPQIWICDRDGTNPRQITRFERAHIENPCWSYDERYVAFTAAPGSRAGIHIADVETGEVRCLSTAASHEMCLGWSRDGQWIYCKSEQDDAWRVRKMRTAGGEAVDIMERDIFRLAESADGKRIIYSLADTTGVWTASVAGTDEVCIVDEPATVVPCGWRETGRGVYFFSLEGRVLSLRLLDPATGESSLVTSGADMVGVDIDVSPEGDAVVFDRFEPQGSDLAIVENF